MNTTAWLDQRAAKIRSKRGGVPTSLGAQKTAEVLASHFPDMPREKLGAVVMTVGALLQDAWKQLETFGEPIDQIPVLLCCLTDTAGDYLYAPEGGRLA